MAEWEVARSSGRCRRCDGELNEGQEYVGVLVEAEGGFEREDYCLTCWDEQPAEHFCFWKTRVPVKEEKKDRRLLVDDAVLINFFERLDKQTDPIKVRFRFVLALILMRKKLLRYEQTVKSEGTERWQMRLTSTNALHQVENPKMDDEQIAEVSRQLGVILRGETPDDDTDPPDGAPFAQDEVGGDAETIDSDAEPPVRSNPEDTLPQEQESP